MEMKNIELEIGGIPLIISSSESGFIQMIADKYRAFIISPNGFKTNNTQRSAYSGCHSPIHLHLDLRQKEMEKRAEEIIKEELWVDVSYQNKKFTIRRPDLEGEIDLISRRARVINRAAVYSFDSFLRILYSLILAQEGGFLLHAAAVIRDGWGYLFMGKSGAGKSTVAAHSSEYTVLSDEISLVKKVEIDYLVYSTPFWGEQEIKGKNFSSPLAGVYQLKQSSRVVAKRLPKREAFRKLMGNILYFSQEPFLTRQLFQNCVDFIQQVSVYELEFQKDGLFWGVIS